MRWMIGGCLVALVVLSIAALFPARYEYRVLAPRDDALIEEMRAAGREGWRVVESRRIVTAGGEGRYELLLERRVYPWSAQGQSVDARPGRGDRLMDR